MINKAIPTSMFKDSIVSELKIVLLNYDYYFPVLLQTSNLTPGIVNEKYDYIYQALNVCNSDLDGTIHVHSLIQELYEVQVMRHKQLRIKVAYKQISRSEADYKYRVINVLINHLLLIEEKWL